MFDKLGEWLWMIVQKIANMFGIPVMTPLVIVLFLLVSWDIIGWKMRKVHSSHRTVRIIIGIFGFLIASVFMILEMLGVIDIRSM